MLKAAVSPPTVSAMGTPQRKGSLDNLKGYFSS